MLIGSTDLGDGKFCVTVDADPRSTSVDLPMGSLAIYAGQVFQKLDDGDTTNFCRIQADDQVSIGGETNPYHETENASYVTVATLVFAGTQRVCNPTAAKWIMGVTGDAQADLRLQDVTNSLTIAELTGQTGTGLVIKTQTTLTNLPVGEAVFEVQIKKSAGAGGNKARIYGFCLSQR